MKSLEEAKADFLQLFADLKDGNKEQFITWIRGYC